MNDDRKPRRPIPLLLWAVLGFALVLGFLFLLRRIAPDGLG